MQVQIFVPAVPTLTDALFPEFASFRGSGPAVEPNAMDPTGNITLRDRVYRTIRAAIFDGRLKSGARLPSSRALARELAVSRITVTAAFEQLAAEGYVQTRVGAGTFVAEGIVRDHSASKRVDQDVVRPKPRVDAILSRYATGLDSEELVEHRGTVRYDLRYGMPAVDPVFLREWRAAMSRVLRDHTQRDVFGYGETAGYEPLRTLLVDYCARVRGIACEPDQIIVVNGSQQGLDLIARVFLDAGDRVVVEDPGYPGARAVFRSAGASLLPSALDPDGMVVPDSSAKLCYVTPSHQFPTGTVMSIERRLALLEWSSRSGALIIEDDYDSEYRYRGSPVQAIQSLDTSGRVIYVGTFSKAVFPALRLGYLVVPRELSIIFRKVKWLADRHSPTLPQVALADVLRSGSYDRMIRRSKSANSRKLNVLVNAVSEELRDHLVLGDTSAGLHVLARFSDPKIDVPAFVDAALARQVGVYSSRPYWMSDSNAAGPQPGLLLGFAGLDAPDIAVAIQRIAGVLADRQ